MKTQLVLMHLVKDMMTHIEKEVYAHEIPLYEAAHPDGVVEVLKVIRTVEVDEGEEFDRLMGFFGLDPESGKPLVEEVYGHGGAMMGARDFIMNKNMVEDKDSVEEAGETPVPDAPPADINELRDTLDALGISFKKNMTSKTLQNLLIEQTKVWTEKLADAGIDVSELDPFEMKDLIDEQEAA